MRLGTKLRLVYCCASPHPTRDTRRSCARNCRRSPAAVRGSALELALAGVSVVHGSTRIALGAPKSCRRISARLAASQGDFATAPSMLDQEFRRRAHVE